MCCIYRQPLEAAVRAIVHTIVIVAVMVAGAFGTFGTFEMFGGVVHASESVTGGCSEVAERYRLRVRLVPAKDVDSKMMETVQTEVVELWRDYGVDIVWEGAWDEKNQSTKPDLFVYFVDHELDASQRRGASAVAWILFLDGVPGSLISVSMAAAERLLNDAPWLDARPMRHAPIKMQQQLLATMIGRALAHEIGHYLLASSKHSEDGLMRPLITPAEFVRVGRRHLKLMPENVRELRAGRLANCQLSASR